MESCYDSICPEDWLERDRGLKESWPEDYDFLNCWSELTGSRRRGIDWSKSIVRLFA